MLRHLGRAARDLLRGRLRRRDDQELRLRQQLGERHRDVARARRQVDEQEVELAPLDVLEELRERLVQHRPAPDDGGVLLDEEADRHDLHAVGLERHDLALGARPAGASRRAPNMRGIE